MMPYRKPDIIPNRGTARGDEHHEAKMKIARRAKVTGN